MESANIAADYLAREAGKGPLPGWPYVPPLEGDATEPHIHVG
jgi:phytoene desaturase